MNITEKGFQKTPRPIKVIQYGEGNFLRAFTTYMFDILNEKTDFNGGVCILKPIEFGSLDSFKEQDGLYTVILRGLLDGKETVQERVVTSVTDAVSCYEDYEAYSALARLPELRFVVSNTTEAGIVYDASDRYEFTPPKSFPGKLTKFLHERWAFFEGAHDKGLVMLPVELIDDNGHELKKTVLMLSRLWQFEEGFISWLETSCVFASTLVDRIVTGYPAGETEAIFERLGFEDRLVVTGEPFALWVIEAPAGLKNELPFEAAGLPVIFTDNGVPYKQRKVRILNGAHTSFALAAYLAGHDHVLEAMEDEEIMRFIHQIIFDEIIPTLDLGREELVSFAGSVIERFKNPYIKHSLLSISLNSVSKWRARCLPSLLDYIKRERAIPERLAFSLAALIAFYSGEEIRGGALIGERGGADYEIRDNLEILEFFRDNSGLDSRDLAEKTLSNTGFFGQDLTEIAGLSEAVGAHLEAIRHEGVRGAMKRIK